jgi:DNA/RNA-binding domain of Phe-tRNA-synthetase-like protein
MFILGYYQTAIHTIRINVASVKNRKMEHDNELIRCWRKILKAFPLDRENIKRYQRGYLEAVYRRLRGYSKAVYRSVETIQKKTTGFFYT